MQSNPEKPWDWNMLSSNPNITWDIVQKNLDKSWNWSSLSININITWDIIKSHPEIRWKFVSFNPNITTDIILKNPDRKWDWDYVRENETEIRFCIENFFYETDYGFTEKCSNDGPFNEKAYQFVKRKDIFWRRKKAEKLFDKLLPLSRLVETKIKNKISYK